MSGPAIAFLLVNAGLLLALPRAWAPLPLIVAVSYMPQVQHVAIGPFNFTVVRLLLLVGALRVLVRREGLAGGLVAVDRLMFAFGAWAVLSSAFHEDPSAALVFRLGLAYNALGAYFLLRMLCQSVEDAGRLCRVTAILLVPVAIEMVLETLTGHNLFSALGGVSEGPVIRHGVLRAQGPFGHAILAGSIGAVSIPLAAALWRTHHKTALAGLAASVAMVLASASSGPILSTLAAAGALALWPYRQHMRRIRWLAVAGYVALDLIMKAPAYYLIGRIDLAGGSTGWHRARLIESGLAHLSEWWLTGTDHTRHWMPTGVAWSADQTDITNYYLGLGALGGLPLLVLFVAILAKAFSSVGEALRRPEAPVPGARFLPWALGASLFAHAVTALGVSYFDQSFVFLYSVLAAIIATRPACDVTAVARLSWQAMPSAPAASLSSHRLPNETTR